MYQQKSGIFLAKGAMGDFLLEFSKFSQNDATVVLDFPIYPKLASIVVVINK